MRTAALLALLLACCAPSEPPAAPAPAEEPLPSYEPFPPPQTAFYLFPEASRLRQGVEPPAQAARAASLPRSAEEAGKRPGKPPNGS